MGYQQTIVLETSVLDEILFDVPVLVRLVPESVDYDAIAPDGSDVRFFAADGEAVLPFEIEAWHPDGVTDVWVLLPQAGPDEDTIEIRLVYAQPMPPPTMPSSEVWRAGYEAVWHLPNTVDASGNGHDLVPVGAMPESVMGVVGESLRFVDPSEPLRTPDDSPFGLGGSATIEAWVRPIELGNAGSEDRIVVGKGASYRLVTVASITEQAMFTLTLGGGTAVTAAAAGDLTTEWTLLAGMLDQSNGNTTVCLWHGLPAPVCQVGSLGAILGAPEPLQIGSAFAGADIDEVRFANIVRPASWQRLQLRSLQPGFATFGDPEPL
jgi:biopolymer transport protein ExbB